MLTMSDAIPTYTVVRMYDDAQGRAIANTTYDRVERAIGAADLRAYLYDLPYGVLCLDTNRIVYTTEPTVAA